MHSAGSRDHDMLCSRFRGGTMTHVIPLTQEQAKEENYEAITYTLPAIYV